MTTQKLITILLIILVFTSCERNNNLTTADYKWMPYSGNETLVFSSNNGGTDTIFFVKKDTLIATPDAPNPFGTTYQEVAIFCKHSDPSPPDGQHRYLENYLFKIEKSKDKKARISFNILAKDAVFYKLSGLRIDSLSNQTPMTFSTKGKTYNDVYVVDDEDWLNFKQRSDYITKLYWSKSAGLIRFDKQNNIYWELTEKYSR
jgi:hypothetical protein